MADVQTIVTQLNAPPLCYSISLVGFSQRSPSQLRQILVQVLCFICPTQRKNLESESLETSTACLMELLRSFNYRPELDTISFRQGMALGSAEVIYPVLSWLLPQVVGLKKHAYLSQYLAEVEMPGEFLMDEDCNILQMQCEALREHFKANYCRLETLHKVNAERDPAALKENIQGLEAEKHHLALKISKIRNKLQNLEKLDQMLALLEQSRGELAEEANFIDAVKTQKEALSAAAGKHGKALLKLEYAQALANTPPPFVNEKISQEILMLRYIANAKLPKELDEKQRHHEALQKVLNDPSYSDDKVSRIQAQAKLVAANNELKSLRKRSSMEKRCESLEMPDGETVQWQQGALVAERLKSAFDKLTALSARKEQLVVELSQKSKFIEEIKGTVLRGEELKQFVESLREKSVTYRTMKKVIDEMVSEYGVLRKTQQVLENQAAAVPHPAVPGMMEDMFEAKNGDEELDKAISTLTSLISEVSESVKQNKQKLSPKVKQLQALRKTKQDLEIAHSEKKRHHSEVSSLYERKIARLQIEVESSERDFGVENMLYQQKCAELEAVESSLEELYKEQQGLIASAELQSRVEEQENLKEKLEQRLQKLEDVAQYNHLQMAMMKDLVTILSVKLKQYSSTARPAIYSSVTTLENAS